MPFRTLRLIATTPTIDSANGGGRRRFWARWVARRALRDGGHGLGRPGGRVRRGADVHPAGSSLDVVTQLFGGSGPVEQAGREADGADGRHSDRLLVRRPRPRRPPRSRRDDRQSVVLPSSDPGRSAARWCRCELGGLVLEAVTQVTGEQKAVGRSGTTRTGVGAAQAGNELAASSGSRSRRRCRWIRARSAGWSSRTCEMRRITGMKGAVPAGFELGSRPDPATILHQFSEAPGCSASSR